MLELKTRLSFIAVSLITLLSVACTTRPAATQLSQPVEKPAPTPIQPGNQPDEGYGGGFQVSFIPTNSIEGDNYSFVIEEGSPLLADLTISHTFPEELTYGLVMLVDYRQVPFSLNGKSARIHIVQMKPGVRYNFTLAVGPLPKGRHDLALIAIREPERHSFTIIQQMRSTYSPIRRATVTVGQPPLPLNEHHIELAAFSATPAGAGYYETWLSSTPGPEGVRLPAEVSASAGSNLYVVFGVPDSHVVEDEMVTYAVVGFLDNEQTELVDKKDVLYVKAAPGSLVTIPLDIPKVQKGAHPFFVARFPNPFLEITVDNADAFYSSPTQRIIIVP